MLVTGKWSRKVCRAVFGIKGSECLSSCFICTGYAANFKNFITAVIITILLSLLLFS